MYSLHNMQKAIRDEHLDGWLFFNYKHIDPVADLYLGIDTEAINTRKWFYFVPSQGSPRKICHSVEKAALSHLPGETAHYSGQHELSFLLSAYKGLSLGVQYSTNIPSVSFVDHGTAQMLIQCGIYLVSSAPLIHRTLGVLSMDEQDSHNRAADHLYEIIDVLWNAVCLKKNTLPFEAELLDIVRAEFKQRNLVSEHIPIIASGIHTGDPHFNTELSTKRIGKNEVVQFDIWAKEENGIFADISWIGYTGSEPPARIIEVFSAVTKAREHAVSFIKKRIGSGQSVSGAEVDESTREFLISKGFKSYIAHRTGHSIDRELHGWGVNIDSIEFPDHREIIEGSCFSIEPGLYFKEFGMRSEINCIRTGNQIVVTGPGIQKSLLVFGGR